MTNRRRFLSHRVIGTGGLRRCAGGVLGPAKRKLVNEKTPACDRALASLEGLSVGDAYGEQFFLHRRLLDEPTPQTVPGPWPWTDDTAMAIAIVDVLREHGRIDQDALAYQFHRNYQRDPFRGYGRGMRELLPEIAAPGAWKLLAPRLFGGQGSLGNGSAMRVAPVGAFFAPDLDRVVHEAALSAEVTHYHPEGAAGAIAVAVAAALASEYRDRRPGEFVQAVIQHTPAGPTRRGLMLARDLGPDAPPLAAGVHLGNGTRVTCEDTVPLVVWSAARNLSNFELALWDTLRARGDLDTTCAMVGGILAAGGVMPPPAWTRAREPLP